eukprot:CAMPEP_0196577754 /NCGR_PEP_ID=MMETSP1081-20130531/6768_1 /TAXON_ID=36882 /ORGANISM="Pyramimonas amylifera, Strain CCMP720" /LENGTH=223 /DNA_ID=CAMNT_0041896761 /DNA_START=131 /DNA_END=802 /DNA_ORIENTATION=+
MNTKLPDLPDDGALVGEQGEADRMLGWSRMLAEGSAPLHDMREYCSKGSNCPEELSAGEGFSFEQIRNVTNRGMWVSALMNATRKAVNKEYDYHNEYADRKYALMATEHSGWLQLRFFGHVKQKSFILCEGPCRNGPSNCPVYRSLLTGYQALSFQIDNEELPQRAVHHPGAELNKRKKKSDIFMRAKTCIQVQASKELNGLHTLGIRVNGDKLIMITDIIWF